MRELEEGELWVTISDLSLSSGKHRSRLEVPRGEVFLVTWIQPDEEAPTPWLRSAVISLPSGNLTVSLTQLKRAASSRAIVPVEWV